MNDYGIVPVLCTESIILYLVLAIHYVYQNLEDSIYQSEYPEADIDPKAKNRWAMKFGVH